MSPEFTMKPIAHIKSDFSTKFGVPRQSGLVDALEALVEGPAPTDAGTREVAAAMLCRLMESISLIWN